MLQPVQQLRGRHALMIPMPQTPQSPQTEGNYYATVAMPPASHKPMKGCELYVATADEWRSWQRVVTTHNHKHTFFTLEKMPVLCVCINAVPAPTMASTRRDQSSADGSAAALAAVVVDLLILLVAAVVRLLSAADNATEAMIVSGEQLA